MAGLTVLFVAKNAHGIDLDRSPSWQKTGGEGDCAKDEQDGEVSFRVEPGDAEEQGAPPVGGREAAGCDECDGAANGQA